MKEKISALPRPKPRVEALATAEPSTLPSAPTPSATPIAPEPSPSSRVAKRTSSAQKAVLKMLKVAVPSSAGLSSGVRRMKRTPAARPPEAGGRDGRLGDLGAAHEEGRGEEAEAVDEIATGAVSAATRRPPSVLPPTIATERLPISSEFASMYSPVGPAR